MRSLPLPSPPNWRRVLFWASIILPILLVVYVVTRLLAFAQLFGKLGPHAGIQITQAEVLELHANSSSSAGGNGTDPRPALIPKIIHQIFHNWNEPGSKTLPADWAEMRQSCIDKNPEWEVRIWWTEDSHAFIANEYPWFLETYEGYKFAIQRVDVMRYFAVRKYGGIYIDLDNGCDQPLDPLRYLPAFTTDGGMGALSNNIIGAHPEHPWICMLTDNLIAYNWNWILPYARVMYNSGQWYLTAMWERYHASLTPAAGPGRIPGYEGDGWMPLHRVMMDGRDGADPWVFWNHGGHGGTWGAGDDWFWAWLGIHWVEVVVEVIAAIFVMILSCVCCVRCYRRRRTSRAEGYQRVAGGEAGAGGAGDDVELLDRGRRRRSDEEGRAED